MRKPHTVDVLLLVVTIALLLIGLLSVYSASYVVARQDFGDAWYDVKRQLLFALIGIAAMVVIMRIAYWRWQNQALLLFVIALVLLLVVLVPGIGVVRGGARSWLGIGSFGVQPSEFMKLAFLLFVAKGLSAIPQAFERFRTGLLPVFILMGIVFGLIMLQPDLGTGAVLLGATLFMVFCAGAKWRHLSVVTLIGVVFIAGLIAVAPYRLKRITAFLDPWSDPLGAGYQAIQSLYAVGPGGLFGVGFGESLQKFSYLPEPQTDFIFAIFAEEWGLLGGIVLLALFALLVIRGFMIAWRAPDAFGTLLAIGITGMITVQVFMNIGVVIGLLPVTGVTLPFISAGGSSLILLLMAVGLLLNISKYAKSYEY